MLGKDFGEVEVMLLFVGWKFLMLFVRDIAVWGFGGNLFEIAFLYWGWVDYFLNQGHNLHSYQGHNLKKFTVTK